MNTATQYLRSHNYLAGRAQNRKRSIGLATGGASTGKLPAVGNGGMPAGLPLIIPAPFTAEVLSPYRKNARYLKSAQIDDLRPTIGTPKLSRPPAGHMAADGRSTLMRASGRFSIGESCYIDDTGHFNAVEFNICFNQLAYVTFGKCFDEALIPELSFLEFSEFRRAQLPCWLIVAIDGVRFSKQLDRTDFHAELTLDEIRSARGAKFFFTSIAFSDRQGVKASGKVVLSYNSENYSRNVCNSP
jgi:hypothetical protein